MHYYSPLRYPGGKGIISSFIEKIIEQNSLLDSNYVEPYAGGAGLALDLLYKEYVNKIIINDLDYSIYAFWYSLLNNNEDFCELVRNAEVSINNWRKQKKVQNNRKNLSLLKVGFSTFFLNRTNRSGIITAGPIGGKEQKGKWKIDARFNKNNLIERIKKIGRYKNRINIYNIDGCELVNKMDKELPEPVFYYLDPPYYTKGKELYVHYFGHEDHKKILETVKKLEKSNWLITYDNVDPIKNLYNHFRIKEYSLYYSAANKREGKELMIFDEDLFIPEYEKFSESGS